MWGEHFTIRGELVSIKTLSSVSFILIWKEAVFRLNYWLTCFQTCEAPDYQDGDNQCCMGCTSEAKLHVDSILKVLKTEVQEFQYGPAEVLTLGGIKGKEYRVTIFKNSPFYTLASLITCGERVQVKGWVEEFGPLVVLRVYKFNKPTKKFTLKECLNEAASGSSKKPAPTTA